MLANAKQRQLREYQFVIPQLTKAADMLTDEDLFNPFNVGPPEHGKRLDYDIPNSPTYPPPVFATWPPPKEHTNKSVSQGTLAKQEADAQAALFKTKSQMGEVAISKAINEEMAAAKQLGADKQRIHAGGQSKTNMSMAGSQASMHSNSVRTLMPVKSRRSASKSSLISQVSKSSMAGSMTSVHSQRSMAKSAPGQVAADKLSLRSHASKATESNTTLKSHAVLKSSTKSLNSSMNSPNAREPEPDSVSRHTLRTKAGEHKTERSSRVSLKFRAEENQADNVSRVSLRSQASVQPADNVSRVSVRSKANEQQADQISRVTTKSKASDQQADNDSHVSVKSQTADKGPLYNIEDHKRRSENAGPRNSIGKTIETMKEAANEVGRKLADSQMRSKSLFEKAAELSKRLKAGNEFKHNRFHTLIRMYTTTEPQKKFRDDRMSHWFKDAVLS